MIEDVCCRTNLDIKESDKSETFMYEEIIDIRKKFLTSKS